MGFEDTQSLPLVTSDKRKRDNFCFITSNFHSRSNMTNNKNIEAPLFLYPVFKPLIILLDILQLNGHKLNKGNIHKILFYFRLLFWIFLLVVMLIIIGHKSYYWCREYKSHGLSVNQVFDLSSCIWLLEGTVSLLYLVYWQYSNKIGTINILLTEATCQKGIQDEKKYLWGLSISLIVQIVSYGGYIIAANSGSLFNTAFRIRALKFDGVFFERKDLNLLVLLACTYNSFGWAIATSMYVLIVRCVLSEIKYLNKTIRFDENFDKNSLKVYINLHKKLTAVVDQVSETFSGYYFFMMLFQLPLITLLCFNLLVQNLDLSEIVIILGWIVSGSLKLIALSLSPAEICEQVFILIIISFNKHQRQWRQ